MIYPLVREMAAADSPVRVPVSVACRVLGFRKQSYFKWVKSPVSQREWDDAHLINAARDVHAEDPEFGYRLISDELTADGHQASERRIWRLCSQEGLISVIIRKRRNTKGRPGPAVHDDQVQRVFSADNPNQLWLTDISEHHT